MSRLLKKGIGWIDVAPSNFQKKRKMFPSDNIIDLLASYFNYQIMCHAIYTKISADALSTTRATSKIYAIFSI